MAVTVAEVQDLILLEVGDIDPTSGDPGIGVLRLHINALWDRYSDKALIAPRLQELYVKRAALELVLAVLSARVDFTEGPTGLSVKQSQQVADRRAQLAAVQAEIARVERQALTTRGPAVGALTTTAPVTPPVPPPGPLLDANDPGYGGSPYRPRRLGQVP